MIDKHNAIHKKTRSGVKSLLIISHAIILRKTDLPQISLDIFG